MKLCFRTLKLICRSDLRFSVTGAEIAPPIGSLQTSTCTVPLTDTGYIYSVCFLNDKQLIINQTHFESLKINKPEQL